MKAEAHTLFCAPEYSLSKEKGRSESMEGRLPGELLVLCDFHRSQLGVTCTLQALGGQGPMLGELPVVL
jgi:hypothetical protein